MLPLSNLILKKIRNILTKKRINRHLMIPICNDIVQQLQNIQIVLNELSKSVATLTTRIDALEQPNNKLSEDKNKTAISKKTIKSLTTQNKRKPLPKRQCKNW